MMSCPRRSPITAASENSAALMGVAEREAGRYGKRDELDSDMVLDENFR